MFEGVDELFVDVFDFVIVVFHFVLFIECGEFWCEHVIGF